MTQVEIFQIKPFISHNGLDFSYDSISQISTNLKNNLSIEFQNNSDKTLAILEIYNQQYNFIKNLDDENYINNCSYVLTNSSLIIDNFIFNNELKTSLDYKSINKNILNMNYLPYVFLITDENNYYIGHCYLWKINSQNKTIYNMIGIHTLDDCFKTTLLLLNYILDWISSDNNNNKKYLRFFQPIDHLKDLLENYGFILAKHLINKSGYEWITDNTLMGLSQISKGLLFREDDYIFEIN